MTKNEIIEKILYKTNKTDISHYVQISTSDSLNSVTNQINNLGEEVRQLSWKEITSHVIDVIELYHKIKYTDKIEEVIK